MAANRGLGCAVGWLKPEIILHLQYKSTLKIRVHRNNSGYDVILSGIDVYKCFEGICRFHIEVIRG
jgi:hypothetical protein